MDRAGATISDVPMVDGAGRSPCAGLTFTENAVLDSGNEIIFGTFWAVLASKGTTTDEEDSVMKKLFSLMLACLLLFSLSACGRETLRGFWNFFDGSCV